MRHRRMRLHGRGARLLIASAALVAVTAAAGAGGGARAGTTTKPYTAVFSPGPVSSGASATIDLTITNLTSPQAIGSANVTAAINGSTAFTIVGASFSGSAVTGSETKQVVGNVLQLRNLSVAYNKMLTVSISVTAPCTPAGAYVWGIEAKQSNDFSGPPGNDFYDTSPTADQTTSVSGGGCRLVWVNQPSDSQVAPAKVSGTDGSPVQVKAVGGDGSLLSGAAGTVTLGTTGGTPNDPSCSPSFSANTAALSAGYATFTGLTGNCLGHDYTLTARLGGYADTPPSGPFWILKSVTKCTGTDPSCSSPTVDLNLNTNDQATGNGSFVFIGISTLNIARPAGCQTWTPLGDSTSSAAPFVVIDRRSDLNGDLYVTYGVSKTLIAKKYGNNSGQQFIPICLGAMRIRLNPGTHRTEPVPCDKPYTVNGVDYAQTPWIGKTLNSDGTFNQSSLSAAACDPGTGYWFGIAGSFQDYTNADPSLEIDPSTSPTVTAWTSDTIYRYFTIRFPSSSAASGTFSGFLPHSFDNAQMFAGVPWDGFGMT